MTAGRLQVTLQSEKVGKAYVERRLQVKELMVRLYDITTWMYM
jgi:hypothetical protein